MLPLCRCRKEAQPDERTALVDQTVVAHCWKMYQQGQISADHTAKEVFGEVLESFAKWLAARAADPWQPIETAPKDGTYVLLTNGKDVAQGQWLHEEAYIRELRDLEGRWIGQDESDGFDGWIDFIGGMPTPTHWMPMPIAPIAPIAPGAKGASDAR